MNHQFKTFADAESAGYAYPSSLDKDVSGANSYGYVYERKNGQRTVTVWASEEFNRARQKGSFQPMFPPATPAEGGCV